VDVSAGVRSSISWPSPLQQPKLCVPRVAERQHRTPAARLRDRRASLEPFDALVGTWEIEATHPMAARASESSERTSVIQLPIGTLGLDVRSARRIACRRVTKLGGSSK
jgi:hypothetical protein